MRTIPGMTIIVPADGPETERAIEECIKINGPVYIRLGRAEVSVITSGKPFEIGRANILKQGKDGTIIACGGLVPEALEASQLCESKGISVGVIDMHTIKPLDKDAVIKAAKQTGAIITAEEHNVMGGLGSAVAEVIAEEGLSIQFKRIGMQDTYGESGDPKELFKKYGLSSGNIADTMSSIIRKK
jgi:transketolase